jgi:acetate kinase
MLDPASNTAGSNQERVLSAAKSPIKIMVVPTNEELQIAREAVQAVS